MAVMVVVVFVMGYMLLFAAAVVIWLYYFWQYLTLVNLPISFFLNIKVFF